MLTKIIVIFDFCHIQAALTLTGNTVFPWLLLHLYFSRRRKGGPPSVSTPIYTLTSVAYKWIPQEWSLLSLPTIALLPISSVASCCLKKDKHQLRQYAVKLWPQHSCKMCKEFIWYDTKKTGLISHSESSALWTCRVYGIYLWSREEQFITRKLEIFAVITGRDQENTVIVLYVPNVNQ